MSNTSKALNFQQGEMARTSRPLLQDDDFGTARVEMETDASSSSSSSARGGALELGHAQDEDDDEQMGFDNEDDGVHRRRLITPVMVFKLKVFAPAILFLVGLCVVLNMKTHYMKKLLHSIAIHISTDFIINFLAGGVSGAVAKTFTAPIERVKLLIQTQDANPKIISGEVAPYTGIVDCFTRVSREQGVGAFWRGNLTNIARYFPTQAFNFAFKDGIKSLFPKADKKTQFAKFFAINVASGGLAGAGSLLIVYPLDYARTRLASDVGSGKQQFEGLWDCLKTTYTFGGIGGLYNGIGISIAGIIPYRGVYFGLFDTLSGLNPYQSVQSNLIRAASKFACAQTSAIVAAYASYPLDTVRRRLQMQSEKPREEWVYEGTADCFAKITREEGVAALFKGAAANALRTIGAAMVLVLYSEITAALSGDK